MNIKSLLLGSAAALVAVSGARAADAIVIAEPEPMEYVRICDVYGTGFFYIPGTETCLQISGYVWAQGGGESYRAPTLGGTTWTPSMHFGPRAANHFRASTRARLNFDARSDTEWGTLRGYIRLQGDWEAVGVANDGGVGIDQAFLELGGLRMGYTESAWVQSQSAGVAQFGSHTWQGMYYGYQQRQLISYTFAGGNGFHATLSLENDTVAGSALAGYHGRGYVPDVVGVVGINQGWGGVWAKAGFDERIRGGRFARSGWGAQVGLQYNIPNYSGSSFRLIGYYADSDNQYGPGSPLFQARWSVLASYRHQFTPTIGASVGLQYFNGLYFPFRAVTMPRSHAWAAEAMLIWTPVTNFEVRAEYGYVNARASRVGLGPLRGTHSGFLRFTRYF